MLAAALRSLLVNLDYIHRTGRSATRRLVIVDSWREALLLRVLVLLRIARRCAVKVVTRPEQLTRVAEQSKDAGFLVILTLRVCSRHYQTVAALRRRTTILVI